MIREPAYEDRPTTPGRLAPILTILCLGAIGAGAGKWWKERPERYLAEATRLVDEGALEEAEGYLDLPESNAGMRERALLLRARIAITRRRPADAVKPLEAIDRNGPNASEAAYWKGRALYEVKQTLLAIQWYRTALVDRPNDAETIRRLSAAMYDIGDQQSALKGLERVVELEPKDARAWRTIALICKENAEFERAAEAYERALKLNPSQPLVRFELAETYVSLGRYLEAEREIPRARGAVPDPDRECLQARCLQNRGESEAFRTLLATALKKNPRHPGLLALRARNDLAEGRTAEAVEAFDRVIEADPHDSQAIYQRGQALRLLGRSTEANRDLDRHGELSKLLAEMSSLNDKANRDPQDPEIRVRLAVVCERLGKPELAASWYRAALAIDNDHRAARSGLTRLRPGDASLLETDRVGSANRSGSINP